MSCLGASESKTEIIGYCMCSHHSSSGGRSDSSCYCRPTSEEQYSNVQEVLIVLTL